MRDLIYFFDGGGRWVIQLAVTLILVAVAIWLMAKKDSPMWDDDPWDDVPGWGEGGKDDIPIPFKEDHIMDGYRYAMYSGGHEYKLDDDWDPEEPYEDNWDDD